MGRRMSVGVGLRATVAFRFSGEHFKAVSHDLSPNASELALDRPPVSARLVASLHKSAGGVSDKVRILMSGNVFLLCPKIGIEGKALASIVSSAADFFKPIERAAIFIATALFKDTQQAMPLEQLTLPMHVEPLQQELKAQEERVFRVDIAPFESLLVNRRSDETPIKIFDGPTNRIHELSAHVIISENMKRRATLSNFLTMEHNRLRAPKAVFHLQQIRDRAGKILIDRRCKGALSANWELRIDLFELKVARLVNEGDQVWSRELRHGR